VNLAAVIQCQLYLLLNLDFSSLSNTRLFSIQLLVCDPVSAFSISVHVFGEMYKNRHVKGASAL